ncbi:hypothetical protein CHH92_00575 [Bacillus sonorensis]|nr:hypothetical protein [Bacillus sonorensis]PAD62001.1 hypothetical protein CHH92_00575 [Bacillus sonorensis]RHJ13763.1 hypothetical protein DW143_04005 [Bacillus sonorensis]TWK72657.1 hypothetical protein CHCC20335_1322 [Bacillus paralicheniformis]
MISSPFLAAFELFLAVIDLAFSYIWHKKFLLLLFENSVGSAEFSFIRKTSAPYWRRNVLSPKKKAHCTSSMPFRYKKGACTKDERDMRLSSNII